MNKTKSRLCDACDSRSNNLCGKMNAAQFPRLTARTDKLRIEAGVVFIVEGDPASHFFSLTSGAAMLFKLMQDGRRQITGFARKDDFLGLAAGDRYAFSAEAIGLVVLCRHSRSTMQTLLREAPEPALRLQALTSNELMLAHEQMLLLGRKTARERLASFLLSELLRQNGQSFVPLTLDLPMRRTDIADYLGLTTETVCRAFSWLKKELIVSALTKKDVSVLDVDRLRVVADGLPVRMWWPVPPLRLSNGPDQCDIFDQL